MKILLFSFLTLITGMAFSQILLEKEEDKISNLLYSENQGWSDGSVALANGTTLSGLIKYNNRTGILAFRNDDDEKTFTARNVAGFEFWDVNRGKKRKFYALPVEEPNPQSTYIENVVFFEVIKEYETFAVISKFDSPLMTTAEHSSGNFNPATGAYTPGFYYSTVTTTTSVQETICFIDENGRIEPYMIVEAKDKEGDASSHESVKGRILNELLLQKYTLPVFEELEAYIKKNRLKLKRRQDFMKVMEYYGSIVHDD